MAAALVPVASWSPARADDDRGEQARVSPTVQVTQARAFAVSRPLRDIIREEALKPKPTKPVDEKIRISVPKPIRPAPLRRPVPGDADLALQHANITPKAIPGPILSFDGPGIADDGALTGGGSLPPDTNGDVGPNHWISAVNIVMEIYNKSGTSVEGPFILSSLFTSLGGHCAAGDDGDPIVLYDHLADRWLLSQFYVQRGGPAGNGQCIAISQTADPTGSYFLYDFPDVNDRFADYPHYGVWPDGYYMSVNEFDPDTTAFLGAGAHAFERAKMLVGDPSAKDVYISTWNGVCCAGGLPSDLDGQAPAVGTPNIFAYPLFAEFGDPVNGVALFDFDVDYTTPGNSTFIERAESPVSTAAYSIVNDTGIPQPPPATTTHNLDSLAGRYMHRLQYRTNGTVAHLVTTHTVDADATAGFRAAPRLHVLQQSTPGASFTLDQDVTFSPDTTHRWMGSAAMDGSGNIALGFSASSTSVFPSIRYTGREPADADNTLQTETSMLAGTGVQLHTSGRWGDYSMLAVDPSDDCTFWYTQEYYTAEETPGMGGGACTPFGNISACWHTRVGTFKFAACGAEPSELSISDATVVESNFGTFAHFTVTLSPAAANTVTVNWATGLAGGAQSGVDYTASSGTLTFSPGVTSRDIAVPILDDAIDEGTEVFYVNLSGATGATILDPQGKGSIQDDDPEPALFISDPVTTEGDTGTKAATFTVTLSAASGRNIDVDFATGGAGTATSGVDYQAKSGSLRFLPGQTNKTFKIMLIGDTVDEPRETYFVNLSNQTNSVCEGGGGDCQSKATIVDNDPPPPGSPDLTIADKTVTEGDAGTVVAQFTVTLSAASANTVIVTWETGAGGTATSGLDYTAASGTVTFTPSQTSKTIGINVAGDMVDEGNETFFVNITSASNANITDSQGKGTINDDDP